MTKETHTMFMRVRFFLVVFTLALTMSALTVGSAFAAKGGSGGTGGGGGASNTNTGSFSLVLLNSTDGLPHYGQNVTFSVSSTAAYPSVALTCYQNGVWVT